MIKNNETPSTAIDFTAPGEFVRVSDELTMHYRRVGHGPIHVILVPGWRGTTEIYEQQLRLFRDSNEFTALSYDPRAQGRSTVTVDGHHYEQHGHDLHGLLSELSITDFVLIGSSAGGADILEYIRLYGDEGLRGLVLLDAWPKARGFDMHTEWVPFGVRGNGDQDDFLRSLVLDLLLEPERVNRESAEWALENPSDENVAALMDMCSSTPDSVAALLNATYWFVDNEAQLRALDGKVPLLYYTSSERVHVATRWAQQNTPQAAVAGHGGHVMYWEDPELFNARLLSFLSQVSGQNTQPPSAA